MDYYSTLGVGRNASPDEIKSAYRKLAMKHHPDRGGDEKKFKEISEAYDVLSDPQKKQMFDIGGDPHNQNRPGGFGHSGHSGPFEFHFGSNNWNDIFGFGFGQGHPRNIHKNKTINVTVDVTFKEILTGKSLAAEITIPGGSSKIINLEIPAGINDGQQIRYQGMGDNSISQLPPGDLIVNIRIVNNTEFKKDGDSLILEKYINVWDAILGCKLNIVTLDDKQLEITVPPGTHPDTVLSCRSEGFPNMRTRQRGNLLIKIKVAIPKNLTAEQRAKIETLKDNF
jgi:DnaJ-class molecular chaperone